MVENAKRAREEREFIASISNFVYRKTWSEDSVPSSGENETSSTFFSVATLRLYDIPIFIMALSRYEIRVVNF